MEEGQAGSGLPSPTGASKAQGQGRAPPAAMPAHQVVQAAPAGGMLQVPGCFNVVPGQQLVTTHPGAVRFAPAPTSSGRPQTAPTTAVYAFPIGNNNMSATPVQMVPSMMNAVQAGSSTAITS
eukprot:7061029-Prymnesium_polylepis.1